MTISATRRGCKEGGTTAERQWVERIFSNDVQGVRPNSPSYLDTKPKQLLVQKDKRKMRKFNVRALQVEKGTLYILRWSPQALAYHKRLADNILKKTKEHHAAVMNHMRTRIRFLTMLSVMVALRGQHRQANNIG